MRNRLATTLMTVALVSISGSMTDGLQTQALSCLVSTANGAVQGTLRGVSCAFIGVPYGAAPVGTLRWRPPQAAPPQAQGRPPAPQGQRPASPRSSRRPVPSMPPWACLRCWTCC